MDPYKYIQAKEKWRERNPDKVREYSRKYAKAHPEYQKRKIAKIKANPELLAKEREKNRLRTIERRKLLRERAGLNPVPPEVSSRKSAAAKKAWETRRKQ